jgi:plastocyanin
MPRTFTMQVYAAAYWILTLSYAYLLFAVLMPAASDDAALAAAIPALVVFFVLFVVAAGAATFLPSAPARRRFWLVALVPDLLFLAMNAPHLPYALSHPSDPAFPGVVPLVLGSIVLVVAGVLIARQSGTDAAAPSVGMMPARWAVAIVLGVALGASLTGYVAAAQGGTGGAALAGEPTTAATLVAEGTKYLTTSYSMKSSDTLGIFVVNHDAFAHSFDIDALNVHVNVPANGTVAVTVKPTGPGPLQFYCSIPGHREAGMEGTIDVQ